MKKNNSQEQLGNKPEKEVATSFKRTRGIIREEIKNSKASSYLESSSSHTPDTKIPKKNDWFQERNHFKGRWKY